MRKPRRKQVKPLKAWAICSRDGNIYYSMNGALLITESKEDAEKALGWQRLDTGAWVARIEIKGSRA